MKTKTTPCDKNKGKKKNCINMIGKLMKLISIEFSSCFTPDTRCYGSLTTAMNISLT